MVLLWEGVRFAAQLGRRECIRLLVVLVDAGLLDASIQIRGEGFCQFC